MPSTTPRSIAEHFDTLEDPRRLNSTQHSLHDILVLSICAVICGADGFTAIEEFGHTKIDFLRRFLRLPHGISSHDTIGRVVALLHTKPFAQALRSSPSLPAFPTRWPASSRPPMGR